MARLMDNSAFNTNKYPTTHIHFGLKKCYTKQSYLSIIGRMEVYSHCSKMYLHCGYSK